MNRTTHIKTCKISVSSVRVFALKSGKGTPYIYGEPFNNYFNYNSFPKKVKPETYYPLKITTRSTTVTIPAAI